MCETYGGKPRHFFETVPVKDAVGSVLAHDITEVRPGEFKGCAFRKGHVIRREDVCHLQRIGKERLFVLKIEEDELHEDDAAHLLAGALMGDGVAIKGEPKEGRITVIAERSGLLKVREDALLEFNMLGDVMCATLHNNTTVREGQPVAATRAIPLVVKKKVVDEAARAASGGILSVKELRRPRAGIVITGNEVYYGRIKDAFAQVITKKVETFGGDVVGICYAPDEESLIEARLRELINAGADLLITTGGMSVDPDDVTRFAIRRLGATDITYGSAVLPGAMFLIAYVSAEAYQPRSAEGESGGEMQAGAPSQLQNFRSAEPIPILGIPACGMYSRTTIFDLMLPRVLAAERPGRRELAELGHGGLCLKCDVCRYPVCPFGK
jgi:molybdenum cofactor synthesis domain-containing protein